MGFGERRKCKCYHKLFRPDRRNRARQHYCSGRRPAERPARPKARRAGSPSPRTGTTSTAVNVDEHKHTIDRLPGGNLGEDQAQEAKNCKGCSTLEKAPNALGKGEVDSSILSGSTRNSR
jgi:hypothetical protein